MAPSQASKFYAALVIALLSLCPTGVYAQPEVTSTVVGSDQPTSGTNELTTLSTSTSTFATDGSGVTSTVVGSDQSTSDTITLSTPTSTLTASSSVSPTSSKPDVGAIAGGTVGGITAAVLMIIGIFKYINAKKPMDNDANTDPPLPHQDPPGYSI